MAHLEELEPWTGWGVNQDRIRPLEHTAVWQPDVLSVNKHNPFESLTSSPAEVALLANAVYAVSLMYSLGLRDKHVHNPALHDSYTLNRSHADWSDHPS